MDVRAGPDSFYLTRSQPDPALLPRSAKTGQFARSRLDSLSRVARDITFMTCIRLLIKLPWTREIPSRIALEIIRKLA